MGEAEFVSLAQMLRQPTPAESSKVDVPADGATATSAPAAADASAPAALAPDVREALRDARLFRARLADLLDDACARLVREIAVEVLARELRLAPADLAAIVRAVQDRMPVLLVRVAPEEASAELGVPVVADDDLAPGDAVLDVEGGTLDARLGVRLAHVLEAFA